MMSVDDKEFDVKNLINIFEDANLLFLKYQKEFILSGVAERSWYTPFADCLRNMARDNDIKGYYVDTEYNKNDTRIKTIYDNESEVKVIRIACDVILHSRGDNLDYDNLICIEMKKSTASKKSKESDKRRVKLLTKSSFDGVWSYDGKTNPEHVCRYKLGIYYEVNLKKQIVYIEYYKEGEKFSDYSINF